MNRMVKRLAIFGLILASQHAQGALIESQKVADPIKMAGGVLGLIGAACVGGLCKDRLVGAWNNVLDGNNNAKPSGFKDDMVNLAATSGVCMLSAAAINLIQSNPVMTNIKPIWNVSWAFGLPYMLLKYLPHAFTNKVTKIDNIPLCYPLAFVGLYTAVKLAQFKAGCNIFSV